MSIATLDKQTYPLMMHLSILPKYDLTLEEVGYDSKTQTSNINAMAGSWCIRSASTANVLRRAWDDDSTEDD
jgi:hypothetical protein